LLANPDINRFDTRYTTVSALCQRWGREVDSNPDAFAAQLDALASQPRASVHLSKVDGSSSSRLRRLTTLRQDASPRTCTTGWKGRSGGVSPSTPRRSGPRCAGQSYGRTDDPAV
jgi:hypothetical protein